MAQYRLLADHYVGGSYLQAGTIVSDTANGELPSNWIPTPACDPIDADAINKFFAAGPQDCADPGRSLGPRREAGEALVEIGRSMEWARTYSLLYFYILFPRIKEVQAVQKVQAVQ